MNVQEEYQGVEVTQMPEGHQIQKRGVEYTHQQQQDQEEHQKNKKIKLINTIYQMAQEVNHHYHHRIF